VSVATSPAPPAVPNTRPAPADRFAWAVATLCGAGLSPIVPGTAGTLAAMPLAVGLAMVLPVWGFVAATLCVTGLGIWAADRTAARLRLKDPGVIVVDEAAGLMVTLIGVPIDLVSAAGAFFLFRAMDVLKPPPARQAESLPGGFGIVTDDLLAGVYANLLLRAALWALQSLR
jgi:phosphatidylglycerophosphatase A